MKEGRTALIKSNNPHLAGGEIIWKRTWNVKWKPRRRGHRADASENLAVPYTLGIVVIQYTKIMHDPKYLIPGELLFSSIFKLCKSNTGLLLRNLN